MLSIKNINVSVDKKEVLKNFTAHAYEKIFINSSIKLYDENGQLITEEAYLGKTITVCGIVDYYSGTYQVKVFDKNHITVIE